MLENVIYFYAPKNDLIMPVNSLRVSDAYMHQYIRPSLVQIMACYLFSVKPLSEAMLPYCLWNPRNKLQWNFHQNTTIFFEEKALKYSSVKCFRFCPDVSGLHGLILGLYPANERRRYFVTTSLIGWLQAWITRLPFSLSASATETISMQVLCSPRLPFQPTPQGWLRQLNYWGKLAQGTNYLCKECHHTMAWQTMEGKGDTMWWWKVALWLTVNSTDHL